MGRQFADGQNLGLIPRLIHLIEQLNLKLDIVAKGMTRLGMHSDQLTSLEALDLFYSFYSPAQAKIQPLTEQALQMIRTALIEKGEPNAR